MTPLRAPGFLAFLVFFIMKELSVGAKPLLDFCQQNIGVNGNLTLTLESKNPAEVHCVVTLKSQSQLFIEIDRTYSVIGLTRVAGHGKYKPYMKRPGKDHGIFLKMNGTSLMWSNADRYVVATNVTVQHDREEHCRKNGIANETCLLREDFTPHIWGNLRPISVTKGSNITLDYKGEPLQDFFSISFIEVIERDCLCTDRKICLGNGTSSHPECVCAAGYVQRGAGDCSDLNECDEKQACSAAAAQFCNNTSGGAHCQCRPGYEGKNCSDVNECEGARPCGPNGVCLNVPGSYRCGCEDNYERHGEKCNRVDDGCISSPCRNNGRCIPDVYFPKKFSCECPETRTGKTCKYESYVGSGSPTFAVPLLLLAFLFLISAN